MSLKTLAGVALLAAICILANTTTFAQLQAGRVLGTVYDPQHAGIPGATVTVTNLATNLLRTAITDSEGNYVVTPLDPGTYRVSAEIPGFQTTVREGLELTVGQAARVELTLSLGGLSTEVRVTAEAPLLNTESATLSQVISNEQIVDMPLNGRGFQELARLTSGVALLPPTGNVQTVRPEAANGNVIGGVAGAQTRFLLDGVDVTEEHQGGTWIQTSVDALQEFSVQQNAYSAEFHGAGATLNVTTKSGGNAFHGSIFEFIRNDAFDSKNFFASRKEKLERNQYGGTLGGPVVIPGLYDGTGKTFFFASYEGQRRTEGNVNVSIVPTAAQRAGDFRGLAPIFDPLTTSGTARDQFADNVIPQSRLSSQALFFNQYIPLPNSAGDTYVSTPITSFHADQVTLRLDQEINSQNRLFMRYSNHHSSEERDSPWPALGATKLSGPAYNIALALTSNFGSSLVHEVRFSRMYGEYRSTAYFQGQGVQLLQQAGVTGLEGIQDPAIATLPAFSFSGYAGFAGNAGDGRPKWQDRGEYEVTDNLTWIKGRHIMKFGGRMYRRNILFTDARSHNGVFNYTGVMTQRPSSPAGTGNAFADYMLGYPISATRSNPATWWGGYGTYWHAFMQDDLRVSDSLTLNLGFRYEYTPWLTGYKGQAAAFDPTREKSIIVSSETDKIDLSVQRLADVGYALFGDLMQTSSQAGIPLQITSNDTKQVAPRLGFAWRPFGDQTVIRGGYGMFYEAEGTSGRLNFNFLPFSLSEAVNATANVVPTRTLGNYFLGVPFGASVGTVGWTPLPLEADMGFDQRWNFGFQHELVSRTSIEMNYVGTKGSNQQQAEPINIPPAGAGNIQARRPYPRFGNLNVHSQSLSSEYHAFQAKLQKRPSAGFWYLVSYTYAKSLATLPAPETGGNYTYETGLASFDIPHLLAMSFGAELPFGTGKRFVSDAGKVTNAIIGGWQAQSIINYRSGLPFTPTVSRDIANTGVGNQRPNRIGSGELDNPTQDAWFDKTAFVEPAAFTYGNSGRGILRGDHVWNVDASLFKRFAVGRSSRVEFRAEAFNLLNSVYFALPNTNIDIAAGGRVTATSNNARQLQFGIKYIF
ncbi:MAG: carboxypeptidase-like regulatory domain-containing protein [Vicinamibacterales bacterium]|nr:carboxypeptidase-like regulatory domain-containing protein [Vicinamibacterales bacterium]